MGHKAISVLSKIKGGKSHRVKRRLSRYILAVVMAALLLKMAPSLYSVVIIAIFVGALFGINLYVEQINSKSFKISADTDLNKEKKNHNENGERFKKDELGCWCVYSRPGNTYRILHLADIHIGNSFISFKKDQKALRAIERVINHTQPDLVVVTGDMVYPVPLLSGSGNNLTATRLFANFMESFGIPWTVTFGNHDEEIFSWYPLESLCEVYEQSHNCLFQRGPDGVTGVSNHIINILNSDGTLNTSLFMLDSHDYINPFLFLHYDHIREDQVEWYEQQIKSISNYYNNGKIVPSLAFFHIPLNEFNDAWELWQNGGDPEVYYHYGEKVEKVSAPIKRSSIFEKMVELGSTRGVFVGHDHYNDFSITYRGIRLTYGKSIDYLAYMKIAQSNWQRGGTLIEIDQSANMEITPLSISKIDQEENCK